MLVPQFWSAEDAARKLHGFGGVSSSTPHVPYKRINHLENAINSVTYWQRNISSTKHNNNYHNNSTDAESSDEDLFPSTSFPNAGLSLQSSLSSRSSPHTSTNSTSSSSSPSSSSDGVAADTTAADIPAASWSSWFGVNSCRKQNELAVDAIQDKIAEQEKQMEQLDKLMVHTEQFLAVRLKAESVVGLQLSMKQLLKYDAQKEAAQQSIQALEGLILRVGLPNTNTSATTSTANTTCPATTTTQATTILDNYEVKIQEFLQQSQANAALKLKQDVAFLSQKSSAEISLLAKQRLHLIQPHKRPSVVQPEIQSLKRPSVVQPELIQSAMEPLSHNAPQEASISVVKEPLKRPSVVQPERLVQGELCEL